MSRHYLRLSLYVGGILCILLAILAVWAVSTARIPSRYLARLPQAVQTYILPASTPILPAVATVSAEDLAFLQEIVPNPTLPHPQISIESVSEQTIDPTRSESPEIPTPTPTRTPIPSPVPTIILWPAAKRLNKIQHQFQTWNNCGPATTAMALSYFDIILSQESIAGQLKPNPEDRNVSPHEVEQYINEQTNLAGLARVNGDITTIRQLIAQNIPVMIEVGIEPPGEYRWLDWYGHYLLVVAYDDNLEQVWVYDSWFGTSEVPLENATADGRILTYTEMDHQWAQFNRNYIIFYRPDQAETVSEILGHNIDDQSMWLNALTQAQAEIEKQPENRFSWFNLGTTLNALHRYEEAALAFDHALTLDLPWRMLWYQFGPYESYYHTGRYEDVLLLANTTLENRPYLEESFYYRSLAHQALGNTNQAEEDLQRAYQLNPLLQLND